MLGYTPGNNLYNTFGHSCAACPGDSYYNFQVCVLFLHSLSPAAMKHRFSVPSALDIPMQSVLHPVLGPLCNFDAMAVVDSRLLFAYLNNLNSTTLQPGSGLPLNVSMWACGRHV